MPPSLCVGSRHPGGGPRDHENGGGLGDPGLHPLDRPKQRRDALRTHRPEGLLPRQVAVGPRHQGRAALGDQIKVQRIAGPGAGHRAPTGTVLALGAPEKLGGLPERERGTRKAAGGPPGPQGGVQRERADGGGRERHTIASRGRCLTVDGRSHPQDEEGDGEQAIHEGPGHGCLLATHPILPPGATRRQAGACSTLPRRRPTAEEKPRRLTKGGRRSNIAALTVIA